MIVLNYTNYHLFRSWILCLMRNEYQS